LAVGGERVKGIKWLNEHLEEAILVLLVCFIACSMMLQVIMRFIFRSPLSWPEEMSQYFLVLAGFISVPYCIRKENTIRIDLLFSFLPRKLQKIVDVLMHIIMVGMMCWLFTGGYSVFTDAKAYNNLTATLRIPLYVIYALCLVFIVLGIFRMIQHIVFVFRSKALQENNQKIET